MNKQDANTLTENNELIKPCNDKCCFCFLNDTSALKSSYIFKGLLPETISSIIKNVHHQVKSYEKGDVIASSGDSYNNLHIIVKGSVVGEITDFEGKIIRIEELQAPEIIASSFIFGDENSLPVDVISSEETRTLVIPRSDLLRIFTQHEKVLHNYLNIIANRAQLLSKKIKLLGLNSIRGKIAHYLLEQVKTENSLNLNMKNTQAELANLFGVSRPSLARVVRDMHNKKIIEAKGKHVVILDKKALSDFLR